MTLVDAIKTCMFQKYLTFSGRATKAEFWKFILFVFLGLIVCLVINSVIFGPEITYRQPLDAQGNPTGQLSEVVRYSSGVVGNLFGLAVLLPWLAVTWRRMHDSGRRGWLPFVPYLGWVIIVAIVLVTHLGGSETVSQLQANGQATTPVSPRLAITMVLAFLCVIILNTYWLVQPSDPGPNKYGPNPHEVSP